MSEIIEHQSEEKKDSSLDQQKAELAELYLSLLDSKKDTLVWSVATLWIAVNPLKEKAKSYLLSQDQKKKKWFFENITDKVKDTLIKKASKEAKLDLEYNRADLDKMKSLIKLAGDNEEKIKTMKTQIQNGEMPSLDESDKTSQIKNDSSVDKTSASSWKLGSEIVAGAEVLPEAWKRWAVIKKLDEVLKYDKTHPIKYSWWGKESVASGLDCSGLLIYTLHQAGLKSPWGDSREIFKELVTKKIDPKDATSSLSGIKPGDAIFWNSTDPQYHWKTGNIPTIEKGGSEYRIHHVAFVKEIWSDWKITIVESSGSQWVEERIVDPSHELTATKHKSELYVGHIDYDGLLAYQGKSDENLLAAA